MSWDDDFYSMMVETPSIDNNNDKEIKVDDFDVGWKLPYNPYEIQKDAISTLIKSKTRHKFIESPTGTGKTFVANTGIVLEAHKKDQIVEYYFNTHDQAEEVMDVVRKLNAENPEEEPIRAVHIAGRARLCNFDEIRSTKNESERIKLCKENTEAKICLFNKNRTERFVEENPILDIRNILVFSSSTGVCPRFVMKKAMEMATLIALPTIYLFIPSFANLHRTGTHYIIDEAHSFDTHAAEFSSSTIIKSQVDGLMNEVDRDFGYIDEETDTLHPCSMNNELQIGLIKVFRELESFPTGTISLALIDMDVDKIIKIRTLLDNHAQMHYTDELSRIDEIPGYIEKGSEFLGRLADAKRHPNKYTFVKKNEKIKTRRSGIRTHISYQLRCLDPAHAFQRVTGSAGSITLFSGTLNPPFMAKILGVDTYIQKSYESPHKNIMAFYVKEFNGEKLTTQYNERTKKMLSNYASSVFNVIKAVPSGGVLIFTTSYKMAQKLYELYDFKVPKFFGGDKGSLRHYKEIAETGEKCVFISALRGSGAEGVNFPDNMARAICILGVPYINRSDPIVAAQKKYYENTYGITFARKWMNREAAVAIGQAFGRGNRHPNDYCVVFLMDTRMPGIKNELPRWVKGSVDWSSDSFATKLEKAKEFLSQMKEERG